MLWVCVCACSRALCVCVCVCVSVRQMDRHPTRYRWVSLRLRTTRVQVSSDALRPPAADEKRVGSQGKACGTAAVVCVVRDSMCQLCSHLCVSQGYDLGHRLICSLLWGEREVQGQPRAVFEMSCTMYGNSRALLCPSQNCVPTCATDTLSTTHRPFLSYLHGLTADNLHPRSERA